MTNVLLMLLAVSFVAPQAEVSTLQGESRVGEWRGLADGQVNLAIAGKEESVPVSEVLEIRFRHEGTAPKFEKPAAVVSLWDGSTLGGSQIKIADKRVGWLSPVLAQLALPQPEV